jgi:hypothetical protein
MADVSKRRWWPLRAALTTDRLDEMFAPRRRDGQCRRRGQQLAAALAHAVIGRAVALFVLRAAPGTPGWRTCGCTSTPRGDRLGGIVDPTLRVLPDDACATVRRVGCPARRRWPPGYRCHRSLAPLFARLHAVSGGAVGRASMWHTVGTAVVGSATQIPAAGWREQVVAMRRGQAVLDALAGFGLPVRRPLHQSEGRPCKFRAALPMLNGSRQTDRAGVLRAAETPGPLEGRAPRNRAGLASSEGRV